MTKNNKNKIHQQYYSKTGTLLPGVTTILQILNKPYLVNWAYNCGRQGIDINKVRNQATSVGSLVHYLITCSYSGEAPNTDDYTQSQIDEAQNSLKSFYAWKKLHEMKIIFAEKPLISEVYGYGGTPDIYGETSEGNILLDFKTSKSIYIDYQIQLASYGQLIYENYGEPPDKGQILRIGKEAGDDFQIKTVQDMPKFFDIFRHLLMVYKLQQDVK